MTSSSFDEELMVVMMERTPFLPLPEGMFIEQIETSKTDIVVSVVNAII